MELSVFERLTLLNVLPAQGDITTIRIVRQLREDLSFSEDEHEQLNFKAEDDVTMWNPEADVVKDVEFGEKAREVVVKAFEKLGDNEAFTEQHLAVYDRFME